MAKSADAPPNGYIHVPSPHIRHVYGETPGCSEIVEHALAVRWDLPAPERQLLLGGAGFELIFLPGGARLHGPTRRTRSWALSGRSWCVTVKFQPGISPAFGRPLVEGSSTCNDGPHGEVAALMSRAGGPSEAELGTCLTPWLLAFGEHVDEECLLVNRICRLAATDWSVNSVGDMAARFSMTTRTLHRLLTRNTGLTPYGFIERRRIQKAVHLLREQPDRPLQAVASLLGFSNPAHFSRSCRELTGLTPSELRGGWRG